MLFQIDSLTLEIVEGDITAQAVSAIVNAANNALWMGSGVAGAIKARGGVEIEREAMSKGPILPGEAVATGAGRLAARHVIHAAVMGQDLRTSAGLIQLATMSALACAEEIGAESIAFPALGTGVGGFPLDRCAELMIACVRMHAPAARHLKTVVFVLFGEEAHQAFLAAAQKLLQTQA